VKPIRYPAYLQWIRTLPCSVCRTTRAVEAAHTGPHGLSQKSSDLCAIPCACGTTGLGMTHITNSGLEGSPRCIS
jgi:hypothetical protein